MFGLGLGRGGMMCGDPPQATGSPWSFWSFSLASPWDTPMEPRSSCVRLLCRKVGQVGVSKGWDCLFLNLQCSWYLAPLGTPSKPFPFILVSLSQLSSCALLSRFHAKKISTDILIELQEKNSKTDSVSLNLSYVRKCLFLGIIWGLNVCVFVYILSLFLAPGLCWQNCFVHCLTFVCASLYLWNQAPTLHSGF
jgi:hypothetical protein